MSNEIEIAIGKRYRFLDKVEDKRNPGKFKKAERMALVKKVENVGRGVRVTFVLGGREKRVLSGTQFRSKLI